MALQDEDEDEDEDERKDALRRGSGCSFRVKVATVRPHRPDFPSSCRATPGRGPGRPKAMTACGACPPGSELAYQGGGV